MPLVSLGPWPQGIDNIHDEYDGAFQLHPKKQPKLVSATNIDIKDDGWPDRRVGTTNRRTGTAYKNLTSCAGLLLLQDGGSIYTIDPDDSFAEVEAVSGLNATAKVEFHEFNNTVYYTNGLVCGKILSSGTAAHWGLTNPPVPTLDTTAGDLVAGRYKVSVTLVDANGAESGVYGSSAVITNGSQDITVDLSASDANATHANIYVSPVDQDALFWNQKVTVGSLPATITDVRGESDRPLRTQMLRSPIPADGISSFLGYMFLWKDNTLFRSRGQTPNLFYARTELMSFPFDIKTVIGLHDGFYVATEKTLHWVSGKSPSVWKNEQVGVGEYASGGALIAGRTIPFLQTLLQTESMVALFAGRNGVIAGLPNGWVVHLVDEQFAFDSAPASANIIYIERDELRQILTLIT